MNSRQPVLTAINHQEPDRVPIDLGGSIVTGIMAGALARLRELLGLSAVPVRVYDQFQMLGEVTKDLVEHLHLDILPVEPESISFNLRNRAAVLSGIRYITCSITCHLKTSSPH